MKMKDLFPYSFENLREMWRTNEEVLQPMVARMRNDQSEWCRRMMEPPYQLSEEQVRHAASRYRLGGSRKGDTVFWLIDQHGQAKDAMVGDTWASELLKQHDMLDREWCPHHCLFGLHLLGQTPLTAIVESVKSCVLLSELFPQYTWMATGYAGNMNADALVPLIGQQVVCFPNTDPTGSNCLLWQSISKEARHLHVHIVVNTLLEQRATPAQKERKIDLVDFLFP